VGTAVDTACPKCGRERAATEPICALCGTLLRVEPAPSQAAPAFAKPSPPETGTQRIEALLAERERLERESSKHAPWIYLGVGLVTAPIFALTPVLQLMGWFLASLVHEMGHSGFAWLCGMPSIPAISPTGHAAALHGEQSVALALMALGGLVFAAWKFLEGSTRNVAIGTVLVVHPLIAFTPARELLFLLAGHGGELAFATLALVKTLDGGFTKSKLERGLYGTVGWFLVGRNAWLGYGLATSSGARAHYASSGSFGLENDLVRASRDVVGTQIETAGTVLVVASIAAVALALVAWQARRFSADTAVR